MSWIDLDIAVSNHYELVNNSRKCTGVRVQMLDDRVRLLYRIDTLQGQSEVTSLREVYQVDALYNGGITKRAVDGTQVIRYIPPTNSYLKYSNKGNLLPFDLTTHKEMSWSKDASGLFMVNPDYDIAMSEGDFFIERVKQQSLGEIYAWLTQVIEGLKLMGRFDFKAP